jgi:hypothetical protein
MASAASWRVSLRLDDQPLMLGNKTLTLGHALFGLNKLPQENFPFHRLRLRTACAGSSGCAPLHVIQVSLITRTTFD